MTRNNSIKRLLLLGLLVASSFQISHGVSQSPFNKLVQRIGSLPARSSHPLASRLFAKGGDAAVAAQVESDLKTLTTGSPHSMTREECLAFYGVNEDDGLTTEVAEERLKIYGRNELTAAEATPLWKLVLEQFEDRLVQILLVVAVMSAVLATLEGEEGGFIEPGVIFAILILNAIVGVWQSKSAEDSLGARRLQRRWPRRSCEGPVAGELPAQELVPGDVIFVRVGDKVPADARLLGLKTTTFKVDEGSLTGESVTVSKSTEPVEADAPIQGKANMIFSGTMVTNGGAFAVVTATGMSTEIGKIQEGRSGRAAEVLDIPKFDSPIFGGWVKGAIYYAKVAVALGVAAIPEGLPAVITLCLSLGTRRMAARNALGCSGDLPRTRRALTTNQMAAVALVAPDQGALRARPGGSGRGVSYNPPARCPPLPPPLTGWAAGGRGEGRPTRASPPSQDCLAGGGGTVSPLHPAALAGSHQFRSMASSREVSARVPSTVTSGGEQTVPPRRPGAVVAAALREVVPLNASYRRQILEKNTEMATRPLMPGPGRQGGRGPGRRSRSGPGGGVAGREGSPAIGIGLYSRSICVCLRLLQRGAPRPPSPAGRPGRPGGGGHQRVRPGGHPRDCDHGRLQGHGHRHRPRLQHLRGGRGRDGPRLCGPGLLQAARGGAAGEAAHGQPAVLPHGARGQAEVGEDAGQAGRGARHDRRRRQRRARAAAGGHRRRHGHHRHRGGQGGGGHGSGGRQLRHHCECGGGGPVHLQQHAELHLLPHLLQPGRDRHHLLQHNAGPARAADPAAPAVGEPGDGRAPRHGPGLQPAGPGRHVPAAARQGRAHHDPLDVHPLLPHRPLRGLRHGGGLHLVVPGPRRLPQPDDPLGPVHLLGRLPPRLRRGL
ncbi:unnamed protein product [Heterosigma akashiwo]